MRVQDKVCQLVFSFVSLLCCSPLAFFQSDGFLKDNNNAAQRLLDGVKYISQSVSELSVKPAKAVTSWLTDQIAPTYWKPNSLILVHDTQNVDLKKNVHIVFPHCEVKTLFPKSYTVWTTGSRLVDMSA